MTTAGFEPQFSAFKKAENTFMIGFEQKNGDGKVNEAIRTWCYEV